MLLKRKATNPFLTRLWLVGTPRISIDQHSTNFSSSSSNFQPLFSAFPCKCWEQKTYASAKPFRCNTYKTPGRGGWEVSTANFPVTLYGDLRAARSARRFCQVYRAAAVAWVCPEKYCSRPPIISVKPLWTLRFRAPTTAGTFFPSTGSSCE